jgi:hypothetical protein
MARTLETNAGIARVRRRNGSSELSLIESGVDIPYLDQSIPGCKKSRGKFPHFPMAFIVIVREIENSSTCGRISGPGSSTKPVAFAFVGAEIRTAYHFGPDECGQFPDSVTSADFHEPRHPQPLHRDCDGSHQSQALHISSRRSCSA